MSPVAVACCSSSDAARQVRGLTQKELLRYITRPLPCEKVELVGPWAITLLSCSWVLSMTRMDVGDTLLPVKLP